MRIRSYILKVWVSTLVGTPVLLAIGNFLANLLNGKPVGTGDSMLGLGPFMIFLSFLLSLPALLLVLLLSPLVVKFIQNPIQVKVLLFAIELVCIVLTMSFIGNLSPSRSRGISFALLFSAAYGAVNAIFSYVYKLTPKNDSSGEV